MLIVYHAGFYLWVREGWVVAKGNHALYKICLWCCGCLCHLDEELESNSSNELDLDVQSEDERSVDSEDDKVSDGYLSDSGSEAGEDDDVTEETSNDTRPYVPPQLQPQTSKVKLRKTINGLINRYIVVNKTDCGFRFLLD